MPQTRRDAVVEFVADWSKRTGLKMVLIVGWLGIAASTFHDWQRRVGQPNRHNAAVPRDFCILPEERATILSWHDRCPDDGYRRLSYIMLDADAVAVSPATVYRVLSAAGRLRPVAREPSKKGTGFHQPSVPHQHWHIDITYLSICGTFYYLCSILDGFSRAIIHWDIAESMREADVELIVRRGLERFPGAKPRVISDNGPQFVADDFKAFIRLVGLTHVRTSPYYPQSNGKKERWYKTLKVEAIRKRTPLSLADARAVVEAFVLYYNTQRLHSAIGYVTPQAMLDGRAAAIIEGRREKLDAARRKRREARIGQAEHIA